MRFVNANHSSSRRAPRSTYAGSPIASPPSTLLQMSLSAMLVYDRCTSSRSISVEAERDHRVGSTSQRRGGAAVASCADEQRVQAVEHELDAVEVVHALDPREYQRKLP